MEFKSKEDQVKFLIEVDRLDLVGSVNSIPDDLFCDLVVKRRSLVTKLKKFNESNGNRSILLWDKLLGIKAWQQVGFKKRLQTSLSKYLVEKLTDSKKDLEVFKDFALKSISSIKTHLYIDLGYYTSVEEEVELQEFLDYCIPRLNSIEWKIYKDVNSTLEKDELELLFRLVNQDKLDERISEKLSVGLSEVKSIKDKLLGEDKESNGDLFWSSIYLDLIEKVKAWVKN